MELNNNIVSKPIDKIKTKEMIESLVKLMGVKLDAVEIVEDGLTNRTIFVIKSTESGLLIGDRGDNFQALTHLIKRIVCKGDESMSSQFAIDVNDYQSSMVEGIKMKAVMLANRVRDLKSDVEMEPMSSYERLVVHGALTDQPGIKTESVGIGRERRVVIKYVA
jgi:spoIIIJ-associated protein